VLAVEIGCVEQGVLEWRLAPQVLLGERWALVGGLPLGADQDHPPLEAFLTEGGRRAPPCQAGTDYHKGFGHQPRTCKLPPSMRVS
jgi:hypothetical protein